ncbi:glycosyltransferase involved in cell wall biosynthesis [Azorhizobium sp. AG788]|uniref:glycosyltransferase n=1 Tax=Azorhizobium sp. AG788 TaxID=2183897 RepID=UPI001060F17A|nr:glycosyltransferase [Azorhizobium sp. AG788]TDT96939.1 glycosyltransferase involved in cell wall biosynthesis [Azorhizobium sp. AG788]
MSSAYGRYFLCDQSLIGFSGHCYAYFEPIKKVLEQEGRDVFVIGHRFRDLALAELGVLSAFTFWCDERNVGQPTGLPEEENLAAIKAGHDRAIMDDLRRLDEQFSFSSSDKIIINSIRHWAMCGVVDWLEQLPETRRPHVALLLHFTAEPERFQYDPSLPFYIESFRRIENSPCGENIHLYADAETLIDEYKNYTRLQVELSPFPHSHFAEPQTAANTGDQRIRVGYVGEARYHKGYQLLPFVVEQIAQTDIADKVEFHFHSFIHDKNAEFFHRSIAALQRFDNVHLYHEAFDSDEYDKFVLNCDVIMVPYLLTYYHSQTSGIYADATGAGIPVIVPRGSWMAEKVKQLGGGALAYPDDYLSFAEALYQVCSNIETYRAAAMQAREKWRSFNTPKRLVEMFESW